MDYETLLFSRDGATLIVTVNRPKALNALSRQVIAELDQVARDAAENDTVRAVILTGAGDRAFVAGADIGELHALAGHPAEAQVYAHCIQAMTLRWERLPKPVIAAVNGYALGGGCELAMAADIRIAAENARFGQPEINLGIVPGAGGSQRLPRLVGKGNAKLLVLGGDPIDAQEAYRLGLVQRVVPSESLLDEAKALAAKLAAKAPVALRLCKEAIDQGSEIDLDRGLDVEAHCFGLAFGTDDAKEGTAAFLEKREARFEGR
ncbi:MAG TPA: enoyl-CoA hydratase-related protein [Chloroflexota bacterium]|nr:enoyl-CoA hydratase-related protein [Chloroflexota bacterium]